MRNFQQLAGGLSVVPLLHQLALHPELWNAETLRTQHPGSPHAAVDDVLLRFQEEGTGFACCYPEQGGVMTKVIDNPECVWLGPWSRLTEAHDIVFNLARVVRAERIGRVLISRLGPGKRIAAHVDGGAVATYYRRYQIPLQNEAGSLFRCEDETVQMRGGDVWWFDNRKVHEVVNNSGADRIAMVVDLKVS